MQLFNYFIIVIDKGLDFVQKKPLDLSRASYTGLKKNSKTPSCRILKLLDLKKNTLQYY